MRESLTPVQKTLINAIWQLHVSEGKPLRRRALADVTGNLKDEQIFGALNGGLLSEINLQGSETAYQLTFYGALLTDDGDSLAAFLRLLMRIVQESHRKNRLNEELPKQDIMSWLRSSNLAPAWGGGSLNVVEERLNLAFKLFVLHVPYTLPFSLGAYTADGNWTIKINPDVRELDLAEDLDAYLDECLDKAYDPDVPISYAKRQSYSSGRKRATTNPPGATTEARKEGEQTSGAWQDGALGSSALTATRTETEAAYDLLGREKVTQALRHLLLEREDTKPFAIGLFGHWGAGKSSQIGFLLDKIADSEPQILVADFNAWKNEKASNVGAMLAQAVVEGLVKDMGILSRVWLALRSSALLNVHIRKAMGWRYIGRFIPLICAWPLLLYLLVFILLVIWKLWLEPSPLVKWSSIGLGGLLVPIIVALQYAKGNLTALFQRMEATKQSISVFRLPDYSAHRGLPLEVHRTLETLCSLCLTGGEAPKKGQYLLLIVDDLDRCSVGGVKEVLDAIRLVASIPRVVTIVAMDERIAFAAVEKHYEMLGHGGREQDLVARDYLAKVLQVSITLPEVNYDGISHYVDNKIFIDLEPAMMPKAELDSNSSTHADSSADAAAGAAGDSQPEAPNDSAQTSNEDKSTAPSSLPGEKNLFKELARAYGFSNPRLLWRLYMAWKLLKALHLGPVYGFRQVEPLMLMMFWREWLHQQERDKREQYFHWMENAFIENGVGEPPPEIVNVVQEQLREKWEERKPLVGVVDAVLLPANPVRPGQGSKDSKDGHGMLGSASNLPPL